MWFDYILCRSDDQMAFEEKTVMMQLGMTVRCDPSHRCNLGVLIIQANSGDKIVRPMMCSALAGSQQQPATGRDAVC